MACRRQRGSGEPVRARGTRGAARPAHAGQRHQAPGPGERPQHRSESGVSEKRSTSGRSPREKIFCLWPCLPGAPRRPGASRAGGHTAPPQEGHLILYSATDPLLICRLSRATFREKKTNCCGDSVLALRRKGGINPGPRYKLLLLLLKQH